MAGASKDPVRPPARRRRAGRYVSRHDALVALVVFVLMVGVCHAAYRRVRARGASGVLRQQLEQVAQAQGPYYNRTGRFSATPWRDALGVSPAAGIQWVAATADDRHWAAAATAPGSAMVCAAGGGVEYGPAPVTCTTRPELQLTLSTPQPAQGTPVVFDVSAPVSDLARRGRAAAERARPSGDVPGPPTTVVWDFGDGSPLDVGPPETHARVTHVMARSPGARRAVRVVVLDATGHLWLGVARAGAPAEPGDELPRLAPGGVGPNRPPVAVAAWRPERPWAESPVTFDAGSSTDPDNRLSSWSWYLDGQLLGSTAVVTHTFARTETGVHRLELRVRDEQGLEDVTTSELVVTGRNQPPVARVVGGDRTVMLGEPLVLRATGPGGSVDPDGQITTYSWATGEARAEQTGATLSWVPAGVGLYRVALTVTDDAGAQARDEVAINVVRNQAAVARVTVSPRDGLSGTLFTFDGQGSVDPDGQVVSYQWQGLSGGEPGGLRAATTGPAGSGAGLTTATVSAPGVYWMRLRVVDDLGGVGLDSARILVRNRAPRAGRVVCVPEVGSGPALSAGRAVACTAAGWLDPDGGTLSYSWDLGPDWRGTTQGVRVRGLWTRPGDQVVRVSGSDGQTTAPNGAQRTTSLDTVRVGALRPGAPGR